MTKAEYLDAIAAKLAGMPPESLARALDYYAEMIDDRVEDGMSEEEATAALGPAEEAARQILMDTPLPQLVRERVRPKRRLRAWEIVLLVLGAPVWLPLALAAAIVLAACYGVLWVVLGCLYIVDASLAIAALAGVLGAAVQLVIGTGADALVLLGGAMVCAGSCVLFFLVCNVAARGVARWTRAFALHLRAGFLRGKTA